MAEIHVERKSGTSWVWWIAGLLAAILVIWALIAWGNRSTTVAVVVPTTPAAVPGAPGPVGEMVPVARILDNPSAWTGRRVIGDARVAQVVSDRGFWVEDGGKRLFVVLNEAPDEIKDVNAGQIVRLNGATVYDRGEVDQVTGSLAPQARRIAESQPAVIAIDSQNLDILQTGVS